MQHFVGRQSEVAALRERVEDGARGQPGIVSIAGEAGVGKTTLAQRMSPEIRLRTGTFITARALEPDVRPPFGLWSDVIGQLHQARVVPDRGWPQLSRIVPAMRASAGPAMEEAGQGTSKYALLDELVAYIRAAAASRPLMIVLDDVQWADHASWEALEHLAASLDHDRLLICLTIRREDAQQFEASRRRLSSDERYREIRLERLTALEVGEWIADALHQAERESELASFLYRYTEGNPLFVVQVLQTLVDEGILWYAGKRWEWQHVDALQLPAAVDDLLARRLGRLSPATAQAMTAAAVIGRSFEFDVLRHVTDLGEDALIDVIDEAVAVGVLDAAADTTGDRFRFAHTLLADALVRNANPRRVRGLHARVAEVLRSLRPDSLTEIAVHVDAAADDERADAYALRSGERAASIYALTDAVASYAIAVRRAPSADARLRARLALIDVARIAGQLDAAEAACEAARAELPLDDVASRLKISRRALQLQLLRARQLAEVVTEGRIPLETARAIDAVEESILILSSIADAHIRLSQRPEAEAAARLATAEAERFGDDRLIADARLRLGASLLERAPHESLVEFDAARERFEAQGDRYGVIRCLVNAGIARARQGDAAAAQQAYEQARAQAAAANIPDLGGLAALNLGVLFQKIGNVDQALMARPRAAARAGVLGDAWFQGRELYEALETRFLVATDRVQEGAAAFDRAHALAASIDEGAALWLVAECVPALSRAGGGDYTQIVRTAQTRASEFGLRPLAERLGALLR